MAKFPLEDKTTKHAAEMTAVMGVKICRPPTSKFLSGKTVEEHRI
jgi:hypothetical protein